MWQKEGGGAGCGHREAVHHKSQPDLKLAIDGMFMGSRREARIREAPAIDRPPTRKLGRDCEGGESG